jgi:hypothetical protein
LNTFILTSNTIPRLAMSEQDSKVKSGKLRFEGEQQDPRQDANSESSEAESEPMPSTSNQREKEEDRVCI